MHPFVQLSKSLCRPTKTKTKTQTQTKTLCYYHNIISLIQAMQLIPILRSTKPTCSLSMLINHVLVSHTIISVISWALLLIRVNIHILLNIAIVWQLLIHALSILVIFFVLLYFHHFLHTLRPLILLLNPSRRIIKNQTRSLTL
jgi:hypothetical protein